MTKAQNRITIISDMNRKLFIGLGNPGKKFENTRHNLGIRVLKAWHQKMQEKEVCSVSEWKEHATYTSQLSVVRCQEDEIVCMFPLTSMNSSGDAVAAYFNKHMHDLGSVLIIHDELELPLGTVRIKEGGSARGHNGVKSIHEALGTQDIPRLRLGIGRPDHEIQVENYVLQRFLPEEEKIVEEMIQESSEILTEIAMRKAADA